MGEIDDEESERKNRKKGFTIPDPVFCVYDATVGTFWRAMGQGMAQSTAVKTSELDSGAHRTFMSIPNLECCFLCQVCVQNIGKSISSSTEVGHSHHRFKDNKWGEHMSPSDRLANCRCVSCVCLCGSLGRWMAERTELNRYARSLSASELIRNPASDDSDHDHVNFKTPDEI